jgi:hypothetical protein
MSSPHESAGVRARYITPLRAKASSATWIVLVLLLASLACWSNDTLFIPPTETPTVTPIPPTPNVEGKFKIGDKVLIGGQGFGSVYLTVQPEPEKRSNRVPNASCYPNTTVTILAIQRAGDVTYYQVACNNNPGWVAEAKLQVP